LQSWSNSAERIFTGLSFIQALFVASVAALVFELAG